MLLFFLMLMTNSVLAAKQQWIDKSYDFGSTDSMVVQLIIPESVKNGIIEHETKEIFDEYFKKRLVDKLLKNKINVFQHEDAFENVDLACKITLQKYITTTQYQPGYSIVESVPKRNTVVDSDGMFKTVTTYETNTKYIPGGNFPVAFMMIKYELVDVNTSKIVWTRIDDEARASQVTQFFHTSPEASDLYKDSLKDYFSSMSSKLIKAKKKRLKNS